MGSDIIDASETLILALLKPLRLILYLCCLQLAKNQKYQTVVIGDNPFSGQTLRMLNKVNFLNFKAFFYLFSIFLKYICKWYERSIKFMIFIGIIKDSTAKITYNCEGFGILSNLPKEAKLPLQRKCSRISNLNLLSLVHDCMEETNHRDSRLSHSQQRNGHGVKINFYRIF